MSITYPERHTRKPSILETLGPVLREAGLVDNETDEFTGDARAIAAALTMGLRQLESTESWGDAFALTLRADWCSLDGADPGDLQMRVTPNGVQLRERTPATLACLAIDHHAEVCDDCWTVRVLNPADQWQPVGNHTQIRIGDDNDGADTRRIEVQRRVGADTVQPEAVWSEPWTAPRYSTTEYYKENRNNRNVDATWVDVAPDVQISEGHTFPRGILVRRATGSESDPWTTPRFLPETHWTWSDLLPDASMQFRCWRSRGEESGWGNYRIEVRQRVGRKPVLAVESTWGERKSGYEGRAVRTNGYTLELFRERRRSYGHRDVEGLRVTDPYGKVHEVLVTDRWVQAAPDLMVQASSQGYFAWRNAVSELPAEATLWTMPEERMLRSREWTMLSDKVRAKIARGRRGVRVEVLRGSPVRRHWWSRPSLWFPNGIRPFRTAHDMTAFRVTFRPDHVAEIQYIASAVLDQ